ncbi:MAG TPA: YbdK family carboxylate-amine ligase [Solirubrobacterales bacterium]|jgi:carboxylate-amine ligase
MASVPTADQLRAAFDATEAYTLGLEEELMLLDPDTAELVPAADEALALTRGDPRFKRELPAAQLEIMVGPCACVSEAAAQLREARRDLAATLDGRFALAAAGVHPTAPARGELNRGGRYDRTAAEFGGIARSQLVFALQVHVAPGDADRALAVYNGLRSYLPEIAALAANAPFHAGEDTGLASIRPKIAEQLPRQGVPPALTSWEEYSRALAWGANAGSISDPGAWWWELRPHPGFGTLELRVPDAQTTVREAAAVAAFAHALVAWLGARHDAGEELAVHPDWVIAENRWWAARDGVEGALADLDTGLRTPTRERIGELIGELRSAARELGCEAELDLAAELAERNGAMRQRAVARSEGVAAVPEWLASRWLA